VLFSPLLHAPKRGSTTVNTKRVNLNVIGKFGVTKVVASFRTDDQNANRSSASNLHQFYITTKVGPVNVKAGNYTSVYRKVNTFLQKKYKKVFFYNKKQK
jgi:hypothetical protein